MRSELQEAIDRSADPVTAARTVEILGKEHPDLHDRLDRDAPFRDALVAVTAASRFLTRLLIADERAAEVLSHLDERAPVPQDEDPLALVRWKQAELLRIAARDLTGVDPLEVVGRNLARLADDVLARSCALAGAAAGGLAVVGMGKLGACELNYSSDIDVLFVGDGDPRAVLEVARRCFRVDVDLRPEGRDGPLTRSLESYEAYWDRWADTWEFQALLKARPSAGDPELGRMFMAAASRRVWTRPFGADELRELRDMKVRSEGVIARKGLTDREVKRGRGGIRDVEFAVQLLQLVHGRSDPALRTPATLPALEELASAGYVDGDDAVALEAAYRFLRTVEHRLQLVEDQQVHAVPADVNARTRLARVLGYRDDRAAPAVKQFDAELAAHQATARSIHERLFFRPLLEAFAGAGRLTPEAAQTRLAAFGFLDVERTRQALSELTRGLRRASRLMEQLLPLLLGWLSEAPDPDLGLLGLRTLVSDRHRAAQLVATFRESPETARRLCLLLGTGRVLTEAIERRPDLIPALGDDARLRPRAKEDVLAEVHGVLGWRQSVDEQRIALQRIKRAETLRIAARDVLGMDDVRAVEGELSGLAEVVLEAALRSLDPPLPIAIVAMGRFGGGELSYASDLDLLVVYRGTTADDFAAAEAVTTALLRFVGGPTPAARIYDVDLDLRPEGKDGPVARSLAGFATYYEKWAQTWERQAALRARPVAGDAEVGEAFQSLVDDFLWKRPFTPDQAREVRRMKARVERERIPAGEDPQFHLKLGRGSLADIEWTVQLLQLQHGVRAAGTMAGLDELERAGVLDPADAHTLRDAYRFCERTRNRLYLVRGAAADSLPTAAEPLARLARSLGMTAIELRDEYRRVTRRARAVVERVFYGAD